MLFPNLSPKTKSAKKAFTQIPRTYFSIFDKNQIKTYRFLNRFFDFSQNIAKNPHKKREPFRI
ncbi:hypothetical protein B0E43_17175 [Algoriphagus sp. A40]|nr:hypothetical protein B0E43_17175 [Algoriphagus sp. A40]